MFHGEAPILIHGSLSSPIALSPVVVSSTFHLLEAFFSITLHVLRLSKHWMGRLGGSVNYASVFGSGHDLTVREFEPRIGLSAVRVQPASDPRSLPLSLPLPSLFPFSLSLSPCLSLSLPP